MYMCNIPLVITVRDQGAPMERGAVVCAGSKWQRENSENQGLRVVLINLSGKVNEEISWLEIDEQVLEKYFQKLC